MSSYIQSDITSGNYIQTEGILFNSVKDNPFKIFLGPKLDFIDRLKIKDSINQKNLKAEVFDSEIVFR